MNRRGPQTKTHMVVCLFCAKADNNIFHFHSGIIHSILSASGISFTGPVQN
jgi:hypothetical protein